MSNVDFRDEANFRLSDSGCGTYISDDLSYGYGYGCSIRSGGGSMFSKCGHNLGYGCGFGSGSGFRSVIRHSSGGFGHGASFDGSCGLGSGRGGLGSGGGVDEQ